MARFEDGSYGTAAGIALIGKVLAGRCKMNYTRVAAGKGTIPEDMTPKTMTAPADYVMDAKISGVTNPVDGECQVTVQINSADVEHGFYCTGLVLYAEDPDEGEVPYTYLVLENEPEWIRPASSIVGKLATFDIIAAVGDVDTVVAAIDPEAIATVARVGQMIAEHNTDPKAHADIIGDAVSAALEVLVASGAVVDETAVETIVKNALAGFSGGGYYGTFVVTVPAAGWVEAEEPSVDHNFVCDVEAADVKSDLVPSGAPVLGSFGIANKAGVVNGCETMDGYVRFFSKSAPEEDFQACIILFSKGGESGGGSSVTIGNGLAYGDNGEIVVNAGEGLDFDANGALTVNSETVMTAEDLVDEEAVMEEVEEILHGDETPETT